MSRDRSRDGRWGRRLVLALPFGWLAVFFLAPFAIVFAISFARSRIGVPPYELALDAGSYSALRADGLYAAAYAGSIEMAALSTVLCLLLGYPFAYAIAKAEGAWRTVLLTLVILPFWTSFLIRVYAWIGILKNQGLLNNLLMALGIVDQPLTLLHTPFAVYVGIVYSYLPFMVLPLYATLERMDPALVEAANDLGARPVQAFLRVTLPLSWPGVAAGSLLVFIPAIGEFVIPDLLGGPEVLMIGKVLWTEFFQNRDWPLAAAVTVVMLALLVAPLWLYQRFRQRGGEGRR